MCCYAGKLLQQPEMNNPTLVVVTDRNDLDGQLYQQFCAAKDLLKQTPEQAESREQLREMLAARQSGGIIFTTIQKFSLESQESDHPVLCTRSNVVVITDEAHRSQYGTKAKLVDVKDRATKEVIGKKGVFGYAKHMRDALPGASFIGLTPSLPAQSGFALRFAQSMSSALASSIHRDADRAGGCEHAGDLWRLCVDLRHRGREGGQGDGADLLGEPAGEAGHQPRRDRRAEQVSPITSPRYSPPPPRWRR
jgi:hypothetical protein